MHDSEFRSLARTMGISDQTLRELDYAMRLKAREDRIKAQQERALVRSERELAAVSRGQFQQSTRRGGVCPRCFMEMPVSGECDC